MKLIQNGTVYTMADAGPIHADILIDQGKIAAIGEHLDIPADCEIIDAAGLEVSRDSSTAIVISVCMKTGLASRATIPTNPRIRSRRGTRHRRDQSV